MMVVLFVLTLWLLHRLLVSRAVAAERLRLRTTLARDLHDEIGSGLSSLALVSDSIGRNATLSDRDRAQLQRISSSAREMVGELREIVWAIDPDSDHLHDVVARMHDVASGLLRDVTVTFNSPPAATLPDTLGMQERRDLLLSFKELLHNVARHSQARRVTIDLQARGGELELVVVDDGVGFNPGGVRPGTGLKSLRARAARIGAMLDVHSAPGHGTRARIALRTT